VVLALSKTFLLLQLVSQKLNQMVSAIHITIQITSKQITVKVKTSYVKTNYVLTAKVRARPALRATPVFRKK
jgi:hypothetical protein